MQNMRKLSMDRAIGIALNNGAFISSLPKFTGEFSTACRKAAKAPLSEVRGVISSPESVIPKVADLLDLCAGPMS